MKAQTRTRALIGLALLVGWGTACGQGGLPSEEEASAISYYPDLGIGGFSGGLLTVCQFDSGYRYLAATVQISYRIGSGFAYPSYYSLALSPGGCATVNLNCGACNQGSPMTVTVDSNNQIAESNEGNNSLTFNPPDTVPPVVSIAAPAAGATVSLTAQINANATDNVGVSRVEFYAGGRLLGTDWLAPFSFAWSTTTVANGSIALTARAYDAAGNVTMSAPVSVTIQNTPVSAPTSAAYDPQFRVPVCATVNPSCDTGSLIDGRGAIGASEPNRPNTLGSSCVDGNSGSYHGDESLDRLTVSTLDGTNLAAGKSARIDATVWVWGAASDHLDLYYALDPASPAWVYVSTLNPSASGAQRLSTTFAIPSNAGARLAVRGQFRYSGSAGNPGNSCTSGSYDDRDDLVFAVMAAPRPPTMAPGVSLGSSNSCRLRTDGTIACWGRNVEGQSTAPSGTFAQVSCGDFDCCARRASGALACWGLADPPPANLFSQISVGDAHSCGVDAATQAAVCWGNFNGGRTQPPAGVFTQVSAGVFHACGIRVDGTVVCWGDNANGRATPPAGTFLRISSNETHNCGIRADRSVTCWGGLNGWGQLSAPSGAFSAVSAGSTNSCGVRLDGSVTCWGHNGFGQSSAPSGTFVDVDASVWHACAVRADGSAACWGRNDEGDTVPPP